MAFPATIPVEDLKKCNGEYDPRKLQIYQALYDGGSAMEAVKPDLLPMRAMEKVVTKDSDGRMMYQERLEKACYARSIAGFVDWLVAAVFHKPPRIAVSEDLEAEKAAKKVLTGQPPDSAPKKAREALSEESREFYSDLQRNADGRGTPLAEMMRDTVLECVLHRRGYITTQFPTTEARAADEASKRAIFKLLRAREIEDWAVSQDAGLKWVRWHGWEPIRDEKEPWKQPTKARHIWIFFTGTTAYTYEAEAILPNHNFEKDASAKLVKAASYSGGLPLNEVRYRTGQWIMECCYDSVKAIFARDASIEHLGDKFAFQLLILKLNRASASDVILPDLGALLLHEGEDAGFIAPMQILDPLFKSAEKLRRDLLNSIHASAQNAASIPQAGRLSGEAVSEMREPMDILLAAFAWPVVQAFQQALDRIIKLRGDPEGCVQITGLDEFEYDEKELEGAIRGDDSDGEPADSGEPDQSSVGVKGPLGE